MDCYAGRAIGSSPHMVGYSASMVTVATIILLMTLVIVVTGAKQAIFKRRNELPVMFHWLPSVGSAISYGQERIRFLDDCQAKVKNDPFTLTSETHTTSSNNYREVRLYFHIRSLRQQENNSILGH